MSSLIACEALSSGDRGCSLPTLYRGRAVRWGAGRESTRRESGVQDEWARLRRAGRGSARPPVPPQRRSSAGPLSRSVSLPLLPAQSYLRRGEAVRFEPDSLRGAGLRGASATRGVEGPRDHSRDRKRDRSSRFGATRGVPGAGSLRVRSRGVGSIRPRSICLSRSRSRCRRSIPTRSGSGRWSRSRKRSPLRTTPDGLACA